MDVDRTAPVIAKVTGDVAAPPATVWATLADLPSWPGWNTGVRKVSADGAFVVGTAFRWRVGPGVTVASAVLDAVPGRSAAWSGRVLGIRATHVWRFDETADGGTHVESEESWTGLGPRLLSGPLRKALAKALADGVTALTAEAERRTALPSS
jgi:hypothetical protein